MRARGITASEADEQRMLAKVLDLARLRWCHTPNGGSRNLREAANLKRAGVKAGVPDVLIFTPTAAAPHGVALELKRMGETLAAVRDEQWEWLRALEAVGWRAVVAFGADDAVAQLRGLGYRV